MISSKLHSHLPLLFHPTFAGERASAAPRKGASLSLLPGARQENLKGLNLKKEESGVTLMCEMGLSRPPRWISI